MTKRILIVEDQEDLRGILRDLLTGSGYEVAEAADGRDGVAKAKSERPDLILMDIQLPILDGYETTRQIREDPNIATTPIIAGGIPQSILYDNTKIAVARILGNSGTGKSHIGLGLGL